MVLVTGARRGIGRAVAQRFLAGGWRVAINDIHAEDLETTARELGEVSAHPCDVSDPGAVDSMMQEVLARHSRIDALVNNAGVIRFESFLAQRQRDFVEMLGVNLIGPLLCTQAAARHWIAGGLRGSVVMVSSMSAEVARAGHAAYGASKAALERLASVAALELGAYGIRVNCVVPGGPIWTEFVEQQSGSTGEDRLAGRAPLGRVGEPADVAEVVYFLAGREASFVTGANVRVDGGRSLGGL